MEASLVNILFMHIYMYIEVGIDGDTDEKEKSLSPHSATLRATNFSPRPFHGFFQVF
jgi:hypothetical protein